MLLTLRGANQTRAQTVVCLLSIKSWICNALMPPRDAWNIANCDSHHPYISQALCRQLEAAGCLDKCSNFQLSGASSKVHGGCQNRQCWGIPRCIQRVLHAFLPACARLSRRCTCTSHQLHHDYPAKTRYYSLQVTNNAKGG